MLVILKDNYSLYNVDINNPLFKLEFGDGLVVFNVFDISEMDYKKAILRKDIVNNNRLTGLMLLKHAKLISKGSSTLDLEYYKKYEDIFTLSSHLAYGYAVYILKERFIKGEDCIIRNNVLWHKYSSIFNLQYKRVKVNYK